MDHICTVCLAARAVYHPLLRWWHCRSHLVPEQKSRSKLTTTTIYVYREVVMIKINISNWSILRIWSWQRQVMSEAVHLHIFWLQMVRCLLKIMGACIVISLLSITKTVVAEAGSFTNSLSPQKKCYYQPYGVKSKQISRTAKWFAPQTQTPLQTEQLLLFRRTCQIHTGKYLIKSSQAFLSPVVRIVHKGK